MENNRQKEREFVLGLVDDAKFLSENIITLRNELRETIRRCKKYVDIDWEIALKIIQLERAYNELFNIRPMSFDEFKEYVLKRVEYTPKEWRYTHYVNHYISGASDYWEKPIKGENGDAKYQIIFRKYDMQPDLLDFEPTINLLYYDENVNQDNMVEIILVAPKHTINEVEDIAKTMYDAYKPFVVKNE